MKIRDRGRNRLLTALKTLPLCFGYWMRSGLDVLVGLRGWNVLTSAETLDTFEKLWVEIVGDFKSSYHKLHHFLKKKKKNQICPRPLSSSTTTERTECRSERGVFPVSVLQPEKSTGEKTRVNGMLLNSKGGYSRKPGNPSPPSLFTNNLQTLEWLLRSGNLCIPSSLTLERRAACFLGDVDAQTWQRKRGMLPFFYSSCINNWVLKEGENAPIWQPLLICVEVVVLIAKHTHSLCLPWTCSKMCVCLCVWHKHTHTLLFSWST